MRSRMIMGLFMIGWSLDLMVGKYFMFLQPIIHINLLNLIKKRSNYFFIFC